MKKTILSIGLLLSVAAAGRAAESAPKQFLRYIYGGDEMDLSAVCHPSDDVWMLRGAKNPKTLAAVDTLKLDPKPTGVFSGQVGTDLYFIEMRDGLVDPEFNLDGIYRLHRKLVGMFLYAALLRDRPNLHRLATDAGKIHISGKQAGKKDVDRCLSLLDVMPMVRSSKPADDARSRTITYRVPLGGAGLALTLTKEGSVWKVDTSNEVYLHLEFFFR